MKAFALACALLFPALPALAGEGGALVHFCEKRLGAPARFVPEIRSSVFRDLNLWRTLSEDETGGFSLEKYSAQLVRAYRLQGGQLHWLNMRLRKPQVVEQDGVNFALAQLRLEMLGEHLRLIASDPRLGEREREAIAIALDDYGAFERLPSPVPLFDEEAYEDEL